MKGVYGHPLLRPLWLMTLCASSLGCGALCARTASSSETAAGSSETAAPASASAQATHGPQWLSSLQVGDTLVYHVSALDGADTVAHVHVARLVRQGVGVAALLWPDPQTARELGFHTRWLAADDHGIHQLFYSDEMRDPQFMPLDAQGRVRALSTTVSASGPAAHVWSLPHALQEERATLGGGWEVDELDFQLEGPVRGDRCARIVHNVGARTTRVVVCANVGIVEVVVDEDQMTVHERWRLMAIEREGAESARLD